MDVLSTAIASLVWGAPWIAGVAIGWIAYGRRKSAGLRLALTAFASLFVLHNHIEIERTGWRHFSTSSPRDGALRDIQFADLMALLESRDVALRLDL